MGRKKIRPNQAGKVDFTDRSSGTAGKLEKDSDFSIVNGNNDRVDKDSSKLTYVDLDRSNWDSDNHLDIAEVVLTDVRFSDGTVDYGVVEDSYRRSNFCLRICLCDVEEGSFKLGQWPSLTSSSIFLEYLILDEHRSEDMGTSSVLFSGTFDGPGESVSGLAHLVSLKFLTLRLIIEVGDLVDVPSFRVRVEILNNAFDACESLLETARKPWKKSMMNVMSWLRPEVTSSEAVYGIGEIDVQPDGPCKLVAKNDTPFDTADFYEAIKPSREEPVLEDVLPDLLPHLRPYQRRATYWMVQREKGVKGKETELPAPYCVPVDFLHKNSRMFYNPFSGNVSLLPESSLSYIYGGILADEMGLGKTVELLACIFAHQKTSSEEVILSDGSDEIGEKIKIQKLERVECICGAASESSKYKGLWVQCDLCDAWQHAECVGYSPNKKALVSDEVDKRGDSDQKSAAKKNSSTKSKHCIKKKDCHIIESDGEYICSFCSQLIEAAKAKIYTHATLVVCPAPILVQWHSEIIRHTRPGSLRICIYEGARNSDSSDKLKIDMTELVTADIVLTTYDVLKEDLSHDPDKEGADRHFLRFQKRYPVVPTLLTRIHWWRLCLDEAQMVESSKACVTEMAMRLHAQHRWCITGTPVQRRLDDLYGLLRFLRASPFDVYRWWVEVIRDPYERRDIVAMKFIQTLFRQIMWRSSKIHVSEELHLPPQEECISWLSLSPIEEHFYQKQHATCVNHAHAIIKKLKDDNYGKESPSGSSASSVLPHSEVAKLLVPLLKLRQACCHPQVGSSGLCSLQNSPLSMGEILEVLIGKAKIEGEEELRKIVVALNGLAGIAVIDQDNKLAISLYKEALVLADENSDDFRLDPLLNLHLNHNLAELLRTSSEYLPLCPLMEAHCFEDAETRKRKATSAGKFDYYYVKRRKTNKESKSVSTTENNSLKNCRNVENVTTQIRTNGDSGKKQVETGSQCQASARCYSDGCLRKTCEKIKQKYLSMFNSKLSLAQQDFQTILMQVSTISQELEEHKMDWWLDALDHIEQNNDSSEELLRKIDDACTRITNEMGSKRIASRVRSISMLKYTIESGVDSLQSSRKKLIDRLMEVNQMMEKPTDDDLESQRYCPNCYDGNGSLCVQCELDKHFRVYEAQLFLVKRSINDTVIASVEEALNLQNRYYELNHFFRNKMTSDESHVDNGKNKQRSARESVQVYRHPSALETSLKVIKTHSKSILGRKGMGVAKKHLLLFEAMRKEFTQARLLSIAQTQLLRAHDEIKMSTSRLRLKESEDEPSAINILIREELVPTKFQLSTDKLLSLSSLERIKGQLRYLKGMVLSKQKTQNEHHNISYETRDTTNFAIPSLSKEEIEKNIDDEPCPICQERYFDQKMVFQCGHFICCKCCLHMSERAIEHSGKSRQKWITCPTCRQRTEFENIAYVVEKQNRNGDVANLGAFQAETLLESSIVVQGSYGTKIEAVTRRILWIILNDQEAKILVFSSWNDVLDVLEHALVSNSVTYVRMKGGRKSQVAIAQFKGQRRIEDGEKAKGHPSNEKPVQVLLMLIQHGANGLNLLEAQHVILVEPLLNPAAEAQAISRIHRVGQDKNTFVHRFLVKSTIEESIYMLNSRRAACSTMSRKAKILKDEPVLTLQDVESLFPVAVPSDPQEEENNRVESLRHLPPSVAAGLAAERRFLESRYNSLQQ
ncbi:uncharacterized protein [Typha angustifolia]|uniref:uncharacterized protein isoform X1 n=2 Tax=Typha angustifolia TaxID=59011 RepID=UPI003C2FB1C0